MKPVKDMTTRELKSLSGKIEKQLTRRARMMASARAKIAAIAKSVGVSARELLDLRKKGAPAKREKAPPPRYVNPANPEETWTGKGRYPTWLKKAIKKNGKTPESFLSN